MTWTKKGLREVVGPIQYSKDKISLIKDWIGIWPQILTPKSENALILSAHHYFISQDIKVSFQSVHTHARRYLIFDTQVWNSTTVRPGPFWAATFKQKQHKVLAPFKWFFFSFLINDSWQMMLLEYKIGE